MGDLAISKITNENVKLTNYRLIGIPLPVVMHVITIPIRSSQIVYKHALVHMADHVVQGNLAEAIVAQQCGNWYCEAACHTIQEVSTTHPV